MTPKQAKTFSQICELPRDNWSWRGLWFSVGPSEVTICEQTTGQPAKAMITLTRKTFEAIIRVYETGSKKKRQQRDYD